MKTRRRMLVQVTTLALLALGLAAAECWAVRPYTPVHPDPVLEPWRWTTFPELRGLGLRCMAEDKEGRMWFGVDDGVRVYDGTEWMEYTEDDGLLGRPVYSVCTASDGSVYVGTSTGISRYRDGRWECVFAAENGVPFWVFDLAQAADGSIWAATWFGALCIRNQEATVYSSADYEAAIAYVDTDLLPVEGVR